MRYKYNANMKYMFHRIYLLYDLHYANKMQALHQIYFISIHDVYMNFEVFISDVIFIYLLIFPFCYFPAYFSFFIAFVINNFYQLNKD